MSYGVEHLVVYVIHYFVARVLFEVARAAGVPWPVLLVVVGVLGWCVWRRRKGWLR